MTDTKPIAFRVLLPLIAIIGFIIGGASAWIFVGQLKKIMPILGDAIIINGPWKTSLALGGESKKNPYVKAGAARFAIWGLSPSEAIYFGAFEDSQGATLSYNCQYTIEGGDLPTRWWSINAYRDDLWIANEGDRYSRSMTSTAKDADGRWRIALGSSETETNNLALGNKPGEISLVLRFYQPDPSVQNNIRSIELPTIERVSCAE